MRLYKAAYAIFMSYVCMCFITLKKKKRNRGRKKVEFILTPVLIGIQKHFLLHRVIWYHLCVKSLYHQGFHPFLYLYLCRFMTISFKCSSQLHWKTHFLMAVVRNIPTEILEMRNLLIIKQTSELLEIWEGKRSVTFKGYVRLLIKFEDIYTL